MAPKLALANPPVSADSAENISFVEFGATGLRQFSGYVREEWLRELTGWRGIRMYREMRDNDPIIGAMFFAIEFLLRGVDFRFEPATDSPDDAEAAEFCQQCMTDTEQTWPELISEILTFLQYGWDLHEIVYKIRGGKSNDPTKNSRYDDGMVGWRKFAGRAQETLLHWDFDESGDAVAMVQLLPTGGPLLRVPLSKCLHFRTRLLKNNPEAVSIMRNAYTSYYFKKRIQIIEAIGVERDLTGLPVLWVPARLMNKDASADDKAQLAALKVVVRDTVRNEQEGFVLPMAYDKDNNPLYKMELLATGGRRQFATTEIIDRYDHRIAATVLADFITLGSGTSSSSGRGSTSQAKSKTDMFGLAVTGFLDLITAEFNRRAVPDLLTVNGLKGQCKMAHGEIDDAPLEQVAAYVGSTVGSGSIVPDPLLEAHLRKLAGFPLRPGSTAGDFNEGGDARAGGDTQGSTTQSDNPADAQGRGQGDVSSIGKSRFRSRRGR